MKKAAPQYQQSSPTRCDCTAAIAHLRHAAAPLRALSIRIAAAPRVEIWNGVARKYEDLATTEANGFLAGAIHGLAETLSELDRAQTCEEAANAFRRASIFHATVEYHVGTAAICVHERRRAVLDADTVAALGGKQ